MAEGITDELERMVDKHGLLHVVTGLACICREKAEHIRVNWQDARTAQPWDRDAKRLDALAAKLEG